MSEQLLTILKLCLLALLYLFFLRVLRSVWIEINGPKRSARRAVPAAAIARPVGGGPAVAVAPAKGRGRKAKRSAPSQLTVLEPADQRGRIFPIGEELTVGRAPGCQITIDDTYASQIHARVFMRDEQVLVEDLGSTNGTFLDRKKVSGPTVMTRGSKLQVGNTVMELT